MSSKRWKSDSRGDGGLSQLVQLVGVPEARPEEGGFEEWGGASSQRLDARREVRIYRLDGAVDARTVPVLDGRLQVRQAALEPFVRPLVGCFEGLVCLRPLEVGEDVAGHGRRPVGLVAGGQPVAVVGSCSVDRQTGCVGVVGRRAAHRGDCGGVPAPGLKYSQVAGSGDSLVPGESVAAVDSRREGVVSGRLDALRVAAVGGRAGGLQCAVEPPVGVAVGRLQAVVDRGGFEPTPDVRRDAYGRFDSALESTSSAADSGDAEGV